eukprot:TRINITY_DN9881_c0_g1_i2.p2 TRINITY_DN9881_c0_g1~~TRINITY_DN9881_c0_g1_i2.p2  ORF type:complete len:143 (+),score=7.17 TRINITY_DN9881_c0_g1_i2:80-508(+)
MVLLLFKDLKYRDGLFTKVLHRELYEYEKFKQAVLIGQVKRAQRIIAKGNKMIQSQNDVQCSFLLFLLSLLSYKIEFDYTKCLNFKLLANLGNKLHASLFVFTQDIVLQLAWMGWGCLNYTLNDLQNGWCSGRIYVIFFCQS